MSAFISGREIKVLHGTVSPDTTTQTKGIMRKPEVDRNTTGASKIWLGQWSALPTPWVPHITTGKREMAAYVMQGHIRGYYRTRLQGLRRGRTRRINICSG